MLKFDGSVTKLSPKAFTAMNNGLLNVALDPGPSDEPMPLDPAKVVTIHWVVWHSTDTTGLPDDATPTPRVMVHV